jgi:hypothetical protein
MIAFDGILRGRGEGIFTGADPAADKVIAIGDPHFGSNATTLLFGREGLNDGGRHRQARGRAHATTERCHLRHVQSRRAARGAASDDRTARVWTVLLACCTSPEEAARLARLAEAVSRYEVSGAGSLTVIDGRERLRTLIRQSSSVTHFMQPSGPRDLRFPATSMPTLDKMLHFVDT